jgi:leucine dehydrogenase
VSKHLWGTTDLDGRSVAIKGVGKVGISLAETLASEGVRLIVADVNPDATEMASMRFGAKIVNTDEIHSVQCDIFSPCALGADLNETTIPQLACAAVVGSANNQLAVATDADRLVERGILYAPDFVVNAGGIINIAAETGGYNIDKADRMIDKIYDNLTEVMQASERLDISTEDAAEHVADERIDMARIQGGTP